MPPRIECSTKEERENYIKSTFWCRGDCDSCGICKVYRGKAPLLVFEDYIEGRRSFSEVQEEYR